MRNSSAAHPATWRARLVRCVLASFASVWANSGSADVWTDPRPILSLHGSGDILAAATSGGVVLWDLAGGRTRLVTTSDALPSHITLDLQLASQQDLVYVATDNGLARGWFDGTWHGIGARADEQGTALFAVRANPAGGCVAGGRRGALLAWQHERVDSLRVPTRTGRVVSLDIAPQYFEHRAGPGQTMAQLASAPAFPLGLVAGLDNDGVWLLRDVGGAPRWLRVGEIDGLPSRYVRDVGVDDYGFVWVATRSGAARLGPGARVTRFDTDPLLSQRIETQLVGADGAVYFGLRDGVARLDPAQEPLAGTRLLTTASPVVALAWTHGLLWWSDGARVQSLAGTELDLPLQLAANHCQALASYADTVWVGHPWGQLSRFDASGGWARYGPESELPAADINSFLRVGPIVFVGTTAGLYAQQPGAGVAGAPRFSPVVELPAWIAAQAFWQGTHWVGGPEGLWRRAGETWTSVPLWAGASEIVSLAVVADTLWATGGRDGIACRVGSTWTRPPVVAELAGAYWGRLPSPNAQPDAASALWRPLVIATDRGVVHWDAGVLRPVLATPDEFFTDVGWWNDTLVGGTHRGLWLRGSDEVWVQHGVVDGVPGAHVRRVLEDGTHLWVATTRGLARFYPGELDNGTLGGFERDTGAGAAPRNHDRERTHVGRCIAPAPRTRVVRRSHVVIDERDMLGTLDPAGLYIGSLHVYDVRGRLVRSLLPQTAKRFVWDLRDTSGRPVARGLFYLQSKPDRPPGGDAVRTRLLVLR